MNLTSVLIWVDKITVIDDTYLQSKLNISWCDLHFFCLSSNVSIFPIAFFIFFYLESLDLNIADELINVRKIYMYVFSNFLKLCVQFESFVFIECNKLVDRETASVNFVWTELEKIIVKFEINLTCRFWKVSMIYSFHLIVH